MNFRKIFTVAFVVLLFLTACRDNPKTDRIDKAVMPAWIGNYSVQNRKDTIETYRKEYIPVYVTNLESSKVSFQVDFDAVACGTVILTPVDDETKGFELNTIVDFTGEATVEGNVATIDITWWFQAPDNVRAYKVWSYLFWVKDSSGAMHYYYFRVDYTS